MLSDIPQFDPNKFIDPKTGQPFQYMSPEYQQAVYGSLAPQVEADAARADNQRGGYYSGASLSNQGQAASNVAFQLEQQAAQQAEAEKMAMENQQASMAMQQQQNQANADQQRSANTAAMKQQAIGGISGSAGQLGGLALMHKYGLLGGTKGNPLADAVGAGASPHANLFEPTAEGMAPGAGVNAAPASGIDFGGAAPGWGVNLPSSGIDFSAGAGMAPGAGASNEVLPAMHSIEGMEINPWLQGAGLGALGGFGASKLGGGGSALGTGLGAMAGTGLGMLATPFLGPAGPLLGSFAGGEIGKYGKEIGNWLGDRFHF